MSHEIHKPDVKEDRKDQPQDLSEKEADFRAAIADKPRSLHFHRRLAVNLRRQKRYKEALEEIEICTSLAPEKVIYVSMKANLLSRMSRYDEAARAADLALDSNPGKVDLYLLSARMRLANLQPVKAQKKIDSAMEHNPDERQLIRMKMIQRKINGMSRRAERKPMEWLSRRLNQRIANVAAEKQS